MLAVIPLALFSLFSFSFSPSSSGAASTGSACMAISVLDDADADDCCGMFMCRHAVNLVTSVPASGIQILATEGNTCFRRYQSLSTIAH